MLRVGWRWICLLALGALPLAAGAQVTEQVLERAANTPQNPSESAEAQKVPLVPGLGSRWRGFNAGVSFAQIHDSSAGWYNLITPALSYSFSRHFSGDASVSIYPMRQVEDVSQPSSGAPPMVTLKTDHGDMSDLVLGAHATFGSSNWRSTATILGTAPTGSRSKGLGAGEPTFDLSDRIDRYFDRGSLLVDVGGGDTSGLFNRQVTRDETSVGTEMHFEAGGVVYLPWDTYLQSIAYELLPIGSQTVYLTTGQPGQPPATVLTGTGVSEENGFTTTLAIPLGNHFTLWSYYNRSLRQHIDSVSTGITYVFRPTISRRRMSMIDRALREAEKDSQ